MDFKKLHVGIFPVMISLILIFLVSGCISQSSGSPQELDSFAQCMSEKGVNMYGSMTCPICAKQEALFGSSFQYIDEIECHPDGENSETDFCIEKGVEKTPTWTLNIGGAETNRLSGFQSLETLSEFSGCTL